MALALALLLLTIAFSADAFSVSPNNAAHGRVMIGPASRTAAGSVMMLGSTRNDDDFPEEKIGEAEYTGDVDWDSEWKKVVERESKSSIRTQSSERPGKDFYKSDAEIAAIRAANKAQTQVQKISNKLPSMPSASSMNMSSLTGDWRVSCG